MNSLPQVTPKATVGQFYFSGKLRFYLREELLSSQRNIVHA